MVLIRTKYRLKILAFLVVRFIFYLFIDKRYGFAFSMPLEKFRLEFYIHLMLLS